jgi:hypothetical protein
MNINLIVRQANSFKEIVKKLPKKYKIILDSEIRKLIDNPELGERKRGDLGFFGFIN